MAPICFCRAYRLDSFAINHPSSTPPGPHDYVLPTVHTFVPSGSVCFSSYRATHSQASRHFSSTCRCPCVALIRNTLSIINRLRLTGFVSRLFATHQQPGPVLTLPILIVRLPDFSHVTTPYLLYESSGGSAFGSIHLYTDPTAC